MTRRHALYFAPAANAPLAAAAERWLGASARDGRPVERDPEIRLDPDLLDAITASPRRYGFHATLKAPMRLADGHTEDELLKAAADFSATTEAVTICRLVPRWIGPFLALVPDRQSEALAALAAEVVRRFERFRAPPGATEMERRLAADLSDRERELLAEYGYPYVLDAFRFHMTLTGPVEAGLGPAVEAAARAHFAAFSARPVPVARLAVFVEPEPGASFRVLESIPLKPALSAREAATR